MCSEDIAEAFRWAEGDAKSNEDKIHHLKGLLASKKIELEQATKWCKEISNTVSEKKIQLDELRAACLSAFNILHVSNGETGLESVPGEEGAVPLQVLKEIRSK